MRKDQGYKKYKMDRTKELKPAQGDKVRVRLNNGQVYKYAKEHAEDVIRRGKGVQIPWA